MGITGIFGGMSEWQKKIFYMSNVRPILKTRALFSDATKDYRSPE